MYFFLLENVLCFIFKNYGAEQNHDQKNSHAKNHVPILFAATFISRGGIRRIRQYAPAP